MMEQRTNILLITTDQQSATMMSCTGNQDLETPNIDYLADHGVRFEKAYTNQPLCVPQRCSWYTGLYPHEHGITVNPRKNSPETLPDTPMMGSLFLEQGYATGYSGKWHIKHPWKDTARHGFTWVNNMILNGADKGIPGDFRQFLKDNPEKPFLFSASFNNPHNICEASRGEYLPDGHTRMPTNLSELPPLPDNFEIPEHEPSILREYQRMAPHIYPTADWDDWRWRLHRWQYARMVEMVDRRVGELLSILKDNYLLENTLIVFTSDHGDGNGHHRWNQKLCHYDEVTRIPFILSKPGSSQGRVDESTLISTGIDLIPTLCGMAGFSAPRFLKGIDHSPFVFGEEPSTKREHLYIENEIRTAEEFPNIMSRSVRSHRFKYTVYGEGTNREMLSDMVNDPGETVNLAVDLAYRSKLKSHRELLRQHLQNSDEIFSYDLIPS